MTLKEGKERVMKLLDDYSGAGQITPDPDMEKKMKALFDMGQRDLAQIKKIPRRFVVTPLEGVREYQMPGDFYQLRRIWADYTVCDNGQWIGKAMILPEGESRKIEVEYYAHPAPITEDTPDTYEFEVEEDAQNLLPYYVAAGQTLADLVVNSAPYQALYEKGKERLSSGIIDSCATVETGGLFI